jgi:hypothetical protein
MMSMIERVFQGAKAEGMRSHFLFNQVAQNGKKTCHHCNRNPQRQKATGANFCEGLPALLKVFLPVQLSLIQPSSTKLLSVNKPLQRKE